MQSNSSIAQYYCQQQIKVSKGGQWEETVLKAQHNYWSSAQWQSRW